MLIIQLKLNIVYHLIHSLSLSQVLNRVLTCITTAKQVYFSEAVLTAGNECVCVLLTSMDSSSQLSGAVISYGLDQLESCRSCSAEYSMAVLNLLTLVRVPTLHPL